MVKNSSSKLALFSLLLYPVDICKDCQGRKKKRENLVPLKAFGYLEVFLDDVFGFFCSSFMKN